uniref:Uncharacterized protein n=1 Tax=Zea mays TaxID=4577 RepID=A0A804QXY9_MAIZE
MLPVPDGQPNNKLEGNEVDEHNCSYDAKFLNREASNLHKDVCVDPCSEDSHRSHLPPLISPQRSAYFHNENDSGSIGICQSSRRGCVDELCAKRQSFKVSKQQVRLSWIIRQISMTCKQQATVYSLQMSSTCQKITKGFSFLKVGCDGISGPIISFL